MSVCCTSIAMDKETSMMYKVLMYGVAHIYELTTPNKFVVFHAFSQSPLPHK